MKNPQDLKEAFDVASRATTGFVLGKKAENEISLAEQVKALQVQIVELTMGSRPTVNYTTNYSQPLAMTTVMYTSLPESNLPPSEPNPPVYYTPTTNAVPPLNCPYKN